MVAFHDRRRTSLESLEEFTPGLSLGPGDSLSKSVLGGRFVVRGVPTDEGRKYVVHEALANGRVITREGQHDTRLLARKALGGITPTTTYDI